MAVGIVVVETVIGSRTGVIIGVVAAVKIGAVEVAVGVGAMASVDVGVGAGEVPA